MLTAKTADKYVLYRKSVQTPESDARFLARSYRKFAGRPLRVYREDFCGTASVCCEFVKINSGNRAIGVDLDPEPLQWCRDHLIPQLTAGQARRIRLLPGDVTKVRTKDVELISAFNFSYCNFTTRKDLLRYFRNVYSSLATNGVFALDAHGGREVPESGTETWSQGAFSYIWDVRNFDPITHRINYRIHFKFRDGSLIRNAFVYDWRLWTLPELREALDEIGFREQKILWEMTDRRTGRGNGRMRHVTKGQMEEAWYAMILCKK